MTSFYIFIQSYLRSMFQNLRFVEGKHKWHHSKKGNSLNMTPCKGYLCMTRGRNKQICVTSFLNGLLVFMNGLLVHLFGHLLGSVGWMPGLPHCQSFPPSARCRKLRSVNRWGEPLWKFIPKWELSNFCDKINYIIYFFGQI